MEILVILVILGAGFFRLVMPRDETTQHSSHEVEPGAGIGGTGYSFNPATGLPMTQNEPFGFDIGGNPYGSDHSYVHLDYPHAMGDPRGGLEAPKFCTNPATGLPMISGYEVGVDVAGNPYGFSNDDHFSHHHSDAFGHDPFESGMGSDSFGSFDSGSGSDWS